MRKAAFVAALALAGCGTVRNLSDLSRADIYGGVVRDFTETGRLLEHTPSSSSGPFLRACDVVLAGSFYTLDVPFSLLADTLTLPITIPASLTKQDRPESPQASYRDAYSPPKMPVLIPDVDAAGQAGGGTSTGSPRD
jgi:uncharacterized protein YceK